MSDDFRNTAESWMDRLGRRLSLVNDLYIFLTVANWEAWEKRLSGYRFPSLRSRRQLPI